MSLNGQLQSCDFEQNNHLQLKPEAGASSTGVTKKSNFTDQEMEILTNLIDKYRPIIANKTTNASFNKKKEAAWRKLTIEFNAASCIKQRTPTQLQNKYKNMKKIARQNKAADRLSFVETEQDTSHTTTPLDEKLMAIGVVTEQMENNTDCDAEYNRYIKEKQAGINSTEEISGENHVLDISYKLRKQDTSHFIREMDMAELEVPISIEENCAASTVPQVAELTELVSLRPSSRMEETVSSISSKKLPLKKGFNIFKSRPNAIIASVKARQSAIEEEALLRKEEHLLKMKRDAEKHAIEMEIQHAKLRNEEQMFKVLVAKEAYYKRLNRIED